jgi:hypothetical protein
VRRDAIRETGSSVFFLLTILHWHLQAKPPCKARSEPQKPRNTTGAWASGKLWPCAFKTIDALPMLGTLC